MLMRFRNPYRPRYFGGWFDKATSALGIIAFAVLMLMVCGILNFPNLSLREWHVAFTTLGRK